MVLRISRYLDCFSCLLDTEFLFTFLSCWCSEDTGKRRSQRSKDFKDVEKLLHTPFQERSITCRPNWKLVLVIVILGTLVTFFHPPAVYNTDHLSNSIMSRYVFCFSPYFHIFCILLFRALVVSCCCIFEVVLFLKFCFSGR